MNYKWNIYGKADNLKDILRTILGSKNIKKEEVKDFINFTMEPHDPFLLTNMDKAVNRINLAIKNEERICILGDYDCDGVTATSTLYIGLRSIYTDVMWQIPNRFKDGYGMNKRLVDVAHENNCKLIITVDNGIAAHEAIKYAESLGIDVIVTDHHQPQATLPTEIVVDPYIDDSYPYKGICGCMVAFKLVMALIPDLKTKNKDLYEELVSITCIGTIADVMSITDENRYYVKHGLEYLCNTKNIGLRELLRALEMHEKTLETDNIGYTIGPCINAAGRLKSADIAVELLLSDDPIEASKLANKIKNMNEERKDLQNNAIEKIEVDENDGFIVVTLDGVGHGILGIIAGKVSEKYNKPCFVLGGNKEQRVFSGSGRSVYDYSIFDCIEKNRDIILGGGGHAAAAGVSVSFDNLDIFKQRCNEHFNEWFSKVDKDDLVPEINITCDIPLKEVNERLINNVMKLRPYGNDNEEPIFVSKNLKVESARIVGKNADCIQMSFSDDNTSIKSIGFSKVKEKYEAIGNAEYVDVAYNVSLNEWPKGTFTPQLKLIDVRLPQ